MAVFADFIAGNQPILALTKDGQIHGLWQSNNPVNAENKWAIYPVVPFAPNETDLGSANYKSPGFDTEDGRTHWLGTDLIGRDVAAGLVHGCRFSLLTALLATLIALIIGVPLGVISGYWGNHGLRLGYLSMILISLAVVLSLYLIAYKSSLTSGFIWGGMLLVLIIVALAIPLNNNKRTIHLPLDLLLSRAIELMISLPGLIVLLAISAAVDNKSLVVTAVILGCLRWVRLAQVSRNESIRLKEDSFVHSARVLGLSSWRIISRHIMPNLLSPILVIVVFGIGGFILLESSLSFLGIGVALDEQTWGSMLSASRRQLSAWWLAIFPGLAIFLSIISVNALGETLIDKT